MENRKIDVLTKVILAIGLLSLPLYIIHSEVKIICRNESSLERIIDKINEKQKEMFEVQQAIEAQQLQLEAEKKRMTLIEREDYEEIGKMGLKIFAVTANVFPMLMWRWGMLNGRPCVKRLCLVGLIALEVAYAVFVIYGLEKTSLTRQELLELSAKTAAEFIILAAIHITLFNCVFPENWVTDLLEKGAGAYVVNRYGCYTLKQAKKAEREKRKNK